MSNFYILIDSRDKSYGSNTSFNISLNDFNFSSGTTVSVSLSELNFYNLQYPVRSGYNTITFYENNDTGVLYTATIPEGNYTASDVATEIGTQLTASSGNAYTYTCAYSSVSGKLTISLTLPDVAQIVSIDTETFGFNPGTAFSATIEAAYPVNMAGVEYIDILLPNLINDNITTNSNTLGVIKRVQIPVSWGGMVSYQSQQDDDNVLIDAQYLNNMRVEIRNPDGSVYVQPDNAYVSIVLKCQALGV